MPAHQLHVGEKPLCSDPKPSLLPSDPLATAAFTVLAQLSKTSIRQMSISQLSVENRFVARVLLQGRHFRHVYILTAKEKLHDDSRCVRSIRYKNVNGEHPKQLQQPLILAYNNPPCTL